MNFDALRGLSDRLTLAAVAVCSSVILGSCGGGGAATTNEQNGSLVLMPAAASLYAGVAYDFQIAGGRAPYLISSSEPVLLPVPAKVTGHSFNVVANQPGVIDANLPLGALPIRSVVITVRDAFGAVFSTATQNGITVGQNFMTGYGTSITSLCLSGDACAGSDSVVRLTAVTNGSRYGNRGYRFCVVRGQFQFVVPEIPSNQPETLVNCFDTVSDHTGVVTGRFRVPATATNQIGTFRVFDIATGVYVDQAFTIRAGVIQGALNIIPNDFTFTGPIQGVCGTGSGDFLVFDGTPPYSATSSSPAVSVSPATSNSQPGRFTITASNPGVCVDNVNIVVTDSQSRRGTVTVSTEEGTTTPDAPPPLVVSPTTANLNNMCGFSTSVTAVGGTGPLSANSNNSAVVAIVSGTTISITRRLHDPTLANSPITGVVTVTDGATVQNVTVNGVEPFCP